MANNGKSIARFIEDHVLARHSADDIQVIIDRLPENSEEAADKLCELLELGSWFCESLVANDIDVSELLHSIMLERNDDENDEAQERTDRRLYLESQ